MIHARGETENYLRLEGKFLGIDVGDFEILGWVGEFAVRRVTELRVVAGVSPIRFKEDSPGYLAPGRSGRAECDSGSREFCVQRDREVCGGVATSCRMYRRVFRQGRLW